MREIGTMESGIATACFESHVVKDAEAVSPLKMKLTDVPQQFTFENLKRHTLVEDFEVTKARAWDQNTVISGSVTSHRERTPAIPAAATFTPKVLGTLRHPQKHLSSLDARSLTQLIGFREYGCRVMRRWIYD